MQRLQSYGISLPTPLSTFPPLMTSIRRRLLKKVQIREAGALLCIDNTTFYCLCQRDVLMSDDSPTRVPPQGHRAATAKERATFEVVVSAHHYTIILAPERYRGVVLGRTHPLAPTSPPRASVDFLFKIDDPCDGQSNLLAIAFAHEGLALTIRPGLFDTPWEPRLKSFSGLSVAITVVVWLFIVYFILELSMLPIWSPCLHRNPEKHS